ncbi:hypothetical protein DSM100685_0157 [Bifidobacterium avesanii]|nr:hypothetical protein DSM100685_0157 [Bifidobacterium avesanii]
MRFGGHDGGEARKPLVERYPQFDGLDRLDDERRIDTLQTTLDRLLAELDSQRD